VSDVTNPEPAGGDTEQVLSVAGLANALQAVENPRQERRLIFAKGENMRHVRHAQLLERWPLLPEEWARRVDAARVAAVDRTPGAATFGR
jgi:hypothetical protein